MDKVTIEFTKEELQDLDWSLYLAEIEAGERLKKAEAEAGNGSGEVYMYHLCKHRLDATKTFKARVREAIHRG